MDEILSNKYEISSENGKETCYKAIVKNAFFHNGKRDFNLEEMAFCKIESDFSKKVEVKITPNFSFISVNILPKNACEYVVVDKEIILTFNRRAKVSLELDNKIYNNLFIFVDEVKVEVIKEKYTYYYGKGVYNIGVIELNDNESLYLAKDAYVYGRIVARGKNIIIDGQGVINGKYFSHDENLPRDFLFFGKECRDLTISNITMIDSPCFTLCLASCKGVKITNITQICYNRNSDGMDICASSDVEIQDCFLRNYDDNISIKAKLSEYSGDCRNIKMINCALWADCAHNMLVGPETDKEKASFYSGITFEDIIILQHKECLELYQGVMAIFCADEATVEKITWKNIIVERMDYGRLISFVFTKAYATTYGKIIKDILVENIICNVNVALSNNILGKSKKRKIENVDIKNLVICGQKMTAENKIFNVSNGVEGLLID